MGLIVSLTIWPNSTSPRSRSTSPRSTFPRLFVDVLGWNHAPAPERAWQEDGTTQHTFARRMVAELGGVAVLQVVAADGLARRSHARGASGSIVSQQHAENILIFTDQRERASQSQWYWVKRGKDEATGKPKNTPRRHEYFRGQPVDLFASKLQAMVVDLSDSTPQAACRCSKRRAASRPRWTSKDHQAFFTAYSEQHASAARRRSKASTTSATGAGTPRSCSTG